MNTFGVLELLAYYWCTLAICFRQDQLITEFLAIWKSGGGKRKMEVSEF